MLDPMTAIGLASSIIAFVEFSEKLVRGALEIYKSSDGELEENRDCEGVTREMNRLAFRLESRDQEPQTDEELALCALAAQCRELSDRLLALLGRIKPADLTSKRQSLWAALKNKYHEKERDELKTRLGECRDQLVLHVNFETMTSVETLSEYVCKNTESLALLDRRVVELSSLGAGAQQSLQTLLAIQQAALQAATGDRILQGLRFEGMHGRYGMVEKAHEKTFRWMFDADGPEAKAAPKEVAMRHEAREQFLSWLSSGTGIFHISGKMGSGKSTLMKYLSCHPETQRRLAAWAGENTLVFASFFFWRPGSQLQKSLGGLCRSLLHDVLAAHPALIESVLPTVWAQAKTTKWRAWPLPVPDEEVRLGITRLVSTEALCARHCFCFFLDGLDEYEASTQHDSLDLVRQLHDWTAAFPAHVKMCVSSREYNVFMKELSAAQRLRLHTLTQYDIHAYVLDRVSLSDAGERAQLTDAIVQKADGIFFWVSLVVQGVRDQIHNSVKFPQLVGYISELPGELEELYIHIIDATDKYSRKRMLQTLAMLPFTATADVDKRVPLDLLAYSFLDHFNADPEFAERDAFDEALEAIRGRRQKQTDIGRDRMTGWCCGLVEADNRCHLSYAHRSVADFLETNDKVQKQMKAAVTGHPFGLLSELMLARMRLYERDLSDSLSYILVYWRQEYHLDHPPYSFLRCLDALHARDWSKISSPSFRGEIEYPISINAVGRIAESWKDSAGDINTLFIQFTSCFMTNLSSCDCVVWRIAHDPTVTDTVSKSVLLFYAAIMNREPIYAVVDALLECNVVTPATRTHLRPTPKDSWSKVTYVEVDVQGDQTIWQHFLMKNFYAWLGDPEYDADKSFVGVVQRLLRHGADPRFHFTTPPQEGLKVFSDTFYFGASKKLEAVDTKRRLPIDQQHKIFTFRWDSREASDLPPPIEISLRDWIRLMDIADKDALLQLVDDQTRKIERAELALDDRARKMKRTELAPDNQGRKIERAELALDDQARKMKRTELAPDDQVMQERVELAVQMAMKRQLAMASLDDQVIQERVELAVQMAMKRQLAMASLDDQVIQERVELAVQMAMKRQLAMASLDDQVMQERVELAVQMAMKRQLAMASHQPRPTALWRLLASVMLFLSLALGYSRLP